MNWTGVANIVHRLAGHRYAGRVRHALVDGASGLGAVARRLSFPGDSFILLALLLAANFLRIYVPSMVADGLFGVTVLFLALSLFRGRLHDGAKTPLLCFAALLVVYGVGLVFYFSAQGASNFAAILFAGVIYAFCYQNAPTLIRAKYAIPLFLVAALALFPLYLLPAGLNANSFSSIFGYLLLTVGLILIARSECRRKRHLWAHVLFLLVMAIGIIFGTRILVLLALLAYPLYWSGYFFLRNRLGAGAWVVTAGLLICFPIVFLGTPHFSEVIMTLESFSRKYTGSGIQTGRETFWRHSLAAISESPWLGRGPGTGPGTGVSGLTNGDSSSSARRLDLPPSCLDASNQGLIADCEILLGVRNTLTGDSELHYTWVPSRSLDSWQGVTVGGAPARVVAVNLPKQGLRGAVPPELGGLDKLEFLRLSKNFLTGPIPPELGRLGNLRVLALDDNALSGPIPPGLGALENLEELRLRGNRLSGEVPPELEALANLSLLHLAGNDFTGTVPPGLRDAADHDLDRDLLCLSESGIKEGLLADCEILLVARDILAGDAVLNWKRSRPISIWQGVAIDDTVEGSREGLRVVALDLTGVGLSGSIPSQFGELDQLISMRLDDNRLTGSIPLALGKLMYLKELRLANNKLSGTIPSELGLLFSLSVLRLAGNEFVGGLPSTLDHVVNHDLGMGLFCIPSPQISYGMLKDCTTLLEVRDVLAGDADNDMVPDVALDWKRSRPISKWRGVKLGGAPVRVVELNLQKAKLGGIIPPELGRLDRLEVLRLLDNHLTGPVPPELGRLTNLRILVLAYNALTGSVPAELGKLENLEELWLAGNRLSGVVPLQLAALNNLSLLRLAGNEFSGVLPRRFYDVLSHDIDWEVLCMPSPHIGEGLLADCETLLAARDDLAGDAVLDWKRSRPISAWQGVAIDDTVGGARVVALDLMGVGLSGRIPSQLGKLKQLISMRLADNRLTGSIPKSLGSLKNLEELWLRGNRLSDSVPSQLTRLNKLSVLRLAGNKFAGDLPPGMRDVASHDLDRELHCPAAPRSNTGLVNDCVVLLELRDRLAGDATLNWSAAVPIDFWQGVTVVGTPARVTELDLAGTGLSGIVPLELSELDSLEALRLSQNALTGPIPPELGQLTNLRELLLGDNVLSGDIPPELGDLEQLRLLHLYQNRLSGSIPPELGELRNLRGLSLALNRLTGAIPAELGRLKNLRWLNLWRNRLSGHIPSVLKRLEQLEFVRLSHNEFVGVVLEDFGNDGAELKPATPDLIRPGTSPELLADRAVLLAVRDVLAGDGDVSLNWNDSTPMEYWEGVVLGGAPARVTALNLPERRLSGHIPPELGKLDRLVSLRLHRNRLTGTIPPELGRLSELRELALGSNTLNGEIPKQLGDLEQLTMLHLRRNQLSGQIPMDLARLMELRTLLLDFNILSGKVPSELAKLPNLEELRLAGNQVDIPPELASIAPLLRGDIEPASSDSDGVPVANETARRAGMDLFCPNAAAKGDGLASDCAALLAARDALAGERTLNWNRALPIGAWQGVSVGGQPPRVFAVNLSRVGLSGYIPSELGQLEKLIWLDLNENALTGAIPPELGMLSRLRRLSFAGNKLSGSIPSELGNLSTLEELRLSGNRLTGPIPAELGALGGLSMMQLGGNEFSGCLPSELRGMADRELELDLLCDSSMESERRLREDAIALMELRDILAGGASLNWSYENPISSWEGVTVGPVSPAGREAQDKGVMQETERVIGLDLSGMDLDGRLPPALGRLEKLIWLRLNDNRLTGQIPPELGQLADLRELGLESNALTGSVPPELGQLAHLSELWLGGNGLTGPIPPELTSLAALRVLQLGGNELSGCIPQFGSSDVMRSLWALLELPSCGSEATDKRFFTLGEAIRSLNKAVDPSTPGGIPRSAHNLFLQVGLQTGIFGLSALGLLCTSLIFNLRARSGRRVTPVQCFAATCTTVILIHNTFEVFLLQNAFTVGCVAWILIGLGAGVVNHIGRVPENPLDAGPRNHERYTITTKVHVP